MKLQLLDSTWNEFSSDSSGSQRYLKGQSTAAIVVVLLSGRLSQRRTGWRYHLQTIVGFNWLQCF